MRKAIWMVGLLGAAAVLPLVWAQNQPERGAAATFQVDPVHSSIVFKIQHMGVAHFYGRFNEAEGTFTLVDGEPSKNTLDVRVKTASIDTANDKRNEHLRSAAFFEADKYPEIRFVAQRWKAVGEKKFEVLGELTLHGETHPLTITLEEGGRATDPMGNRRGGVETTFTIKRSDYGMTNMIGPLGDEVTLMIALEGLQQ